MSPVKEPTFFSRETVSGWREEERFRTVVGDPDRYRALFAEAAGAPARGEATPIYLCDPGAPDEIASRIPAARLITILRQPVDRAYSAYLMKRRFGPEPLGFEDALVEEPRRIEEGWGFGGTRARPNGSCAPDPPALSARKWATCWSAGACTWRT